MFRSTSQTVSRSILAERSSLLASGVWRIGAKATRRRCCGDCGATFRCLGTIVIGLVGRTHDLFQAPALAVC